jgi:ABC-type transport system involved in cytochrome c biogenesis ATPase subunit
VTKPDASTPEQRRLLLARLRAMQDVLEILQEGIAEIEREVADAIGREVEHDLRKKQLRRVK